jgi:hypothetical protein
MQGICSEEFETQKGVKQGTSEHQSRRRILQSPSMNIAIQESLPTRYNPT